MLFPNQSPLPKMLAVGIVDEFNDMLGPAHDDDEAGGLFELAALARGESAWAALGEHALGGFHHNGDDAAGLAALIHHRGIIEIYPHLFGLAGAMEGELLVPVGKRAAGKAHLHHMIIEVGDFGPAFADLAAQKPGMAAAREHRIGIVVDHDAVRAPQQHDGDRRDAPGRRRWS